MPFSLSAGVNVVEKDFTTIIPAVSSSVGAFAGAFAWGPVLDPQLISNENDLVAQFGRPNSKNYTSFFTPANFFSYTSGAYITRVDSGATNACAEPSGSVSSVSVGAQTSIYNAGYTATFSDSDNGVTATATLTLTGTTVASATIAEGGAGYDGVPIISFTGDAGVGATATATVIGGVVTAIAVDTGGSGYTSPTVVFTTNSGGSGAIATANIVDGAISTIDVVDGGSGYVPSTPVVTVSGGGGTNATFSATVTNGVITGLNLLTGGSGYTSRPTITISGAGVGATANPGVLTPTTIASINMTENGDGYKTAATCTIKDDQGNVVTQPTLTINMTYSGVPDLLNSGVYYDSFANGENHRYGEFAAKWPGSLGNCLTVSGCDVYSWGSLNDPWPYQQYFDRAPGTSEYVAGQSGQNDEMHFVVIDRTGAITGAPGTVLETFAHVSKAGDAKLPDGTNNYYVDVINERSKYVWWMYHPSETSYTVGNVAVNWGHDALSTNFARLAVEFTYELANGTDGVTGQEFLLNDANQQAAYALYQNSELYDLSLIFCGKMSATSANWVIQNVAETRKDCMVFCSPQDVDSGSVVIGNTSTEYNKLIAYRNLLTSSSYGSLDSGFKYQYDRYNDKYWWIPLNGDIAGLCARTDYTNDPWFSPGGFNRGQIKNAVKLAHNPDKTARDQLYKNGVNPVVSFPGQGVVLYGDKTLLTKPSAFDRINVRRLFIVLEKAIASAAKYSLFELNDSFTRAQFKSMVEPFLRDVQGRRGIIDFRVKCDDTNNTGEVIDRNEFIGDIFIKPARSINFINLNFIAARTAVSFNEIGG